MATTELCMVAFLFNCGKIETPLYGEYIFEKIVSGKEVSNNSAKIVISVGDILTKEIYADILPFIVWDELCSIEKGNTRYNEQIYAVLMEDISLNTAKKIDKRLKMTCTSYIGMTSVDYKSKDARKQFWKSLVRECSVENETIVFFGCKEQGSIFEFKAKEYGFYVNYDNFPDEFECNKRKYLFSTRQSSYIKEVSQLEIEDGRSDSDRGLWEMNFSLVKEVEIAGVQIWKAIEDINRAYITRTGQCLVIDYIFTSLYQAAQGIERLLKISIELLVYGDENYNREKVNKLLYGHNHSAMVGYLTNAGRLSLKVREKHLIDLLSKFYNSARYNRYSYSTDNTLELKLIREFAKEVKNDNYDEAVKHMYGKSLGKVSRTLYELISQLSRENGIFVYELNSDSVATFVFFNHCKDDLYMLLKNIEQSKRELLWFLIRKGGELPLKDAGKEFEELPFDDMELQDYMHELVCNENSGGNIYDFVSSAYDEMADQDREKWKDRMYFVGMIGNRYVIFGGEDE